MRLGDRCRGEGRGRQSAVKFGSVERDEDRRFAPKISDTEGGGRGAAGKTDRAWQRNRAADTQGIAALPVEAFLVVAGGDAGAPVGGITDAGQIAERREQAHNALGAVVLARPHSLGLVLIAEAVFFGIGDQDDGCEHEGAAGFLVGRSDGKIDRVADARAVKRLLAAAVVLVGKFGHHMSNGIVDGVALKEPAHVRSPRFR